MDSPFYAFTARTIRGDDYPMERCRGKVVLIVNVASECGFTPQYEGLEALYRRHTGRGLLVLGFPCDQFGHQEPGDEAAIESFCSVNFGVTFPLFAKVEVNGPGAHPLFEYLKAAQRGVLGTRAIKWNFTKFLVDRAGTVVRRFGARDTPEAIEAAILPLLEAAAAPAPGPSPA
jgi:glutathione peroxidase